MLWWKWNFGREPGSPSLRMMAQKTEVFGSSVEFLHRDGQWIFESKPS